MKNPMTLAGIEPATFRFVAQHLENMVYTLRFFLENAVCFIILTYLVPVLFTFYIQVC